MKHLKKFNESLRDDKVNELKEFCNSSLAYLLDEGYLIYCYREFDTYVISLTTRDRDVYNGIGFNWQDIKYDYISFLELLSKKYNIIDITFSMRNNKNLKYTVENIINDDLTNKSVSNKQMQNRYKLSSIRNIDIEINMKHLNIK